MRSQCLIVGFRVFQKGTPPLDFKQRLDIATGAAAGIQYLHTVVPNKPLIHGDIKSANILLDSTYKPKLGDFGLAREGPDMTLTEETHVVVSRVRGTKPYLPDEYLKDKDLSPKVDTYSFGIVLLEIASGRRACEERSRMMLVSIQHQFTQIKVIRADETIFW
jgi:interleukin-1 receptor-associated kinase 1